MSAPPLATCVVVAFHRPHSLARLMDELRHPDVEVVVVNVDDDPAVAAVAGERAMALPGNPGYAAAVNAGARRAAAGVVVFTNDDLVVDATSVLALAAVVSSGQADVALPRLVDGDGRTALTVAPLPTPRALLVERMLLPDHRPAWLPEGAARIQKWRAPEVAEEVHAGTAAIVAVDAGWLRAVPLPEAYRLYWEESDWFWQLRTAGARVRYEPAVTATHAGGRDDVRPEKSRLMARNAVRCVRRTQGRRAAAAAWPVVVVWNLRLLVVDCLRAAAGSRPAAGRVAARAAGLRSAAAAWREL
jgi:GT2 family glycosyltransferase